MNDDIEPIEKESLPDSSLGDDWTALEEAEWWNYVFLY